MPTPKNGIPDRWTDYKSMGKRIPGTRFIAFKVPLKQSLNNRVPSSDVFGPWDLLESLEKEKEDLGLIIDLTFTTRYYRPHDLPNSMYYLKIFTAGHEVPSDATILSFKRAVSRFLRENLDNDKLIGVHCTHGLNRTGYMVCRYLIDVDGMDPKKAVELFNSSRGHSIERENYLEDLESGPKRSNEGLEESEVEPIQGQGGTERPPDRPAYSSYDRHHGHPHGQRFPPPLFSPPPLLPCHPPPLLPFPPYGSRWPPPPPQHWRSPPPAAPWRRHRDAQRDERGRPFYQDDEPDNDWRSAPRPEEERRGHYGSAGAPPRGPYPLLPHYPRKAFRNSQPNGHSPSLSSADEDGPRKKPHHRHTHRT